VFVAEGVIRADGVLLVRADRAAPRWWALADVLVAAPEPSTEVARAVARLLLQRYVGCSLVVVPVQRDEPVPDAVGARVEGFAVAGQRGAVVVASLREIALPFGDLAHQLEGIGDVQGRTGVTDVREHTAGEKCGLVEP
jgi:hypothetical protein